MRLSTEKIEAALEEYARNPVHYKEFAKQLGVSAKYGANILRGSLRLEAKRPENFVYNSNEQTFNGRRNYTDSQIAEALQRYVAEEWESSDFSRYLKMPGEDALLVLRGESYKSVPRPPGFALRLHGHKRRLKIQEGLALYFKENWTTKKLADFIGFSLGAARRLLSGETYQDIPTPTSK